MTGDQAKQREKNNQGRLKATDYQPRDGDHGETRIPSTEESRKLASKFRGPYVVTEKLSLARYWIEGPPEIQRTSRVYKGIASVDSMKRCNIQIPQDDDDNGKSSNEESHDEEPTEKRVRRKPIRYQDCVLFVDEK
ncbi:hypothetical protein JTB14_024212 [Gonioctena quinquepunctata]|nr:hypothetical protein JTB14_024212 [Gonioctena quinquepunctata]